MDAVFLSLVKSEVMATFCYLFAMFIFSCSVLRTAKEKWCVSVHYSNGRLLQCRWCCKAYTCDMIPLLAALVHSICLI